MTLTPLPRPGHPTLCAKCALSAPSALLLALAAVAALHAPTAQAAALSSVTTFEDSLSLLWPGGNTSDGRSTIAAPPFSSTAHNYQAYSPLSDQEARMYAVASTHPGTNLGLSFGGDGYTSYTLYSRNNSGGALMRSSADFLFEAQLTNTEASWQRLTLNATSGMRYSMYTNERAQTGGGLDGAEYMALLADMSLVVDGSEVWARTVSHRMDNSGTAPYAFLSNRNPPNTELTQAIVLGDWGPNETRTLRFSFTGWAETNALGSTNAFISMAPLFNTGLVTTAAGTPRSPSGGGSSGGGSSAPVASVPEPGSAALAAAALLLAWRGRRRP